MRTLPILFFIMANCCIATVRADVIPTFSKPAESRLKDNPNAYDRVDMYCVGKRLHDACSIPGSTFSGGGAGLCISRVIIEYPFMRRYATIDMTCVLQEPVVIARDTPCHPDANFQRDDNGRYSRTDKFCEPLLPTPPDRFCRDREIGAACMVELSYQGKQEQEQGVCKMTEETVGHEDGYPAKRPVIFCQPLAAAARNFVDVPWWKKMFQ